MINADWLRTAQWLGPIAGVVLCGSAVLTCGMAWVSVRRAKVAHGTWFWAVLAIFYAFAALDAVVAIRHFVTALGRRVARAGGWYRDRRPLQVLAIALIALGLGWTCWWMWRRLRKLGWTYKLAAAGALLTIALLGEALISLHYLDVLMVQNIGPVPLWALGVAAGSLAVMVGAAGEWRRTQRSRRAGEISAQ